MSARRKRGRSIKVPDAWLQEVAAYKERTGKTLEELGIELSLQMKLSAPLKPARVHEYLSGRTVTEELTAAFAALMGVPPPVLGLEDDLEVQEWCDLGRRLKHETPDRFRQELRAIREVVEVLERHRRR